MGGRRPQSTPEMLGGVIPSLAGALWRFAACGVQRWGPSCGVGTGVGGSVLEEHRQQYGGTPGTMGRFLC